MQAKLLAFSLKLVLGSSFIYLVHTPGGLNLIVQPHKHAGRVQVDGQLECDYVILVDTLAQSMCQDPDRS